MRHNSEKRIRAIDLFELGHGYKTVATLLGIGKTVAQNWLYTYRALGKEALLMAAHKTYSYETKFAAARDVVDFGLSKSEAMEKYGIASLSPLRNWCLAYAEGDYDALKPKPKGRSKKPEKPTYTTREEELEARIRELELENAILKRFNALVDEIEQKQQRY